MGQSRVASARCVSLTAVVASALALLTGCIPVSGPVAIGTLNGEFRVAVCKELIVESAYASVREPGHNSVRFWEASGQVTIPAGSIVRLDEESFGMELGLYSEPTLTSGSKLWFTFLGKLDPNTGTIAEFAVPDGGVQDGMWLTSDGEIQQSPCF